MSSELQQRLLKLVSRAGVLLGSPRMEDVLPGILTVASETVAADGYAIWRLEPERGAWLAVSHAGISEEFAAAVVSQFHGRPADGALSLDPIAAEDVASTPTLAARAPAYAKEGIASVLAIPLSIDGVAAGMLVFYFRRRRVFAPDDVELAVALGHLAGAALRTADLHTEQLRREQQARFLEQATTTLSSSLDYGVTLKAVAALAVPHIADWCAVDILTPGGDLEQLALAHADPARVAFAREFTTKYPPDPHAPTGVHHVIRTGEPFLLPELTDAMIEHGARSAEHRDDIRALRITSYMVVPLRTRQASVGAMTFVSAESGRHFTQADLRFAQTVADRAAVAIDNARAYEEARRANRVKDDFLATLSHELRTPLNAILGYARMMRSGAVPEDRRDAALDVIERNSNMLTQIVEDILDVSRIVSGKLTLAMTTVEVTAIVADAMGTVAPTAERRGVTLHAHLDPPVGAICADPDRLRQVLWNLLSNAVKFTPAGGRVDVRAVRLDGVVEITIADTGRGISAEFLPFIFERFRQADNPSTREQGGLGLGLSIACNIVEMHGGTIHAESAGEGRGATFRVRLPADA
jgi:signal transduction histidine kinase